MPRSMPTLTPMVYPRQPQSFAARPPPQRQPPSYHESPREPAHATPPFARSHATPPMLAFIIIFTALTSHTDNSDTDISDIIRR